MRLLEPSVKDPSVNLAYDGLYGYLPLGSLATTTLRIVEFYSKDLEEALLSVYPELSHNEATAETSTRVSHYRIIDFLVLNPWPRGRSSLMAAERAALHLQMLMTVYGRKLPIDLKHGNPLFEASDINAAAVVSQQFREVFRPYLFDSILWITNRYERISAAPYDRWNEIARYPDVGDPLDTQDQDWPPQDSRRRVHNAHLLFTILHRERDLAERVQRLGLLADCHTCNPSLPFQPLKRRILLKCTLMNHALLASMTNLKELELGPEWHNALLQLPLLPRLDTLILTGGAVDLSTITENIRQPALRCLRLKNLGIGQFNVLPVPMVELNQSSPVDGLNSTVTDLELEAADIHPNAFVYLLRTFGNLRTLNITISCVRQWRATCQINRWDTVDSIFPADDVLGRLGYAMQHVKDSIQCLRIWYDHRAQTKKARLRDRGLLPSFADFTQLRVLEVDPAMLIGRRRCSIMTASEPEYLPVADFSRLLPMNLKTLTVSIDVEQKERLPKYMRDVIHSIISEKCRLRDLLQLYWFEDKVLASNRCCVDQAYFPPQGHYPYDCYPVCSTRWTSPEELEEGWKLAYELLDAGVASRSVSFYDRKWWLAANRFPIPPLTLRVDRIYDWHLEDHAQTWVQGSGGTL